MNIKLFRIIVLSAAISVCLWSAAHTSTGLRIAAAVFNSPKLIEGCPPGWKFDIKAGSPWINIQRVGRSYCLHMFSDGESSFGIRRAVHVDVREYPYISWEWAATRLPRGGDFRKKDKDDQVLQVYVAFPATGWPEVLNTPVIGYIWDSEAPKGAVGRSAQNGGSKLRYIVLRNKSDKTRKWFAEKRNVYEDYRKLFPDINNGEPTGPTKGIQISTNAQNTRTSAEGYISDIYFSSN
ncbi:MAG TPA: DUF3047 domain-containing protein [Syntrophales bacterium]|nr:DUF3047 domain-containing protein [Syntrophales bacterium]